VVALELVEHLAEVDGRHDRFGGLNRGFDGADARMVLI
jgi:hypothetical protein